MLSLLALVHGLQLLANHYKAVTHTRYRLQTSSEKGSVGSVLATAGTTLTHRLTSITKMTWTLNQTRELLHITLLPVTTLTALS